MSLGGYDAWLERPYIDRANEESAFESYCEKNGLDPADPDTEAAYERDRAEAELRAEEELRDAEEALAAEYEAEARLAQYDDDPNPYYGDYSEM